MKTFYIFIAAGGPAGRARGGAWRTGRRRHNAGRRRARSGPAAGPQHACPRERRGRGGAAGGVRGERLPPPWAQGV